MSEFNTCRREGRINWGDDFASVAEIVGLFGVEDPKVLSATSFPVPGEPDVICCILSEKYADGWQYERELGPKLDGRGWNETLRYGETNYNLDAQMELIEAELGTPKTRLVFWRHVREGQCWYKFVGVFKLNRKRTERESFYGDSWCWYDRVATSAACPKAEWQVSVLDGGNLRAHVGYLIKCELLDAVPCEDCFGNILESGAKLWPGTVLRVVGVDELRGHLRCRVGREGRYFDIPKRDVELGYFRLLGKACRHGGTKMVKNVGNEMHLVCVSKTQREKLIERIGRRMVAYKKILSESGTQAHKQLVRALLRENDGSAWSFARSKENPGEIKWEQIPEGFLEAHAIGGSVFYHGQGNFSLFDKDGNYVKLVG